jgi:translocation and assembly module TamA
LPGLEHAIYSQSKGRETLARHRSQAGNRRMTCAAAAVCALWLAASPATAMSELNFRVNGTDAGLASDLEASSFLRAAQAEGRLDPLDVIAAARAEYGRLIGLLYEHGYYAPRIRVLIDGREAADLSTLSLPRSVGRVDVDVEPGPRFTFGQARIGPLAPGSALPEAFATGQVARSTAVRDAVQDAVDDWRAQGHALAEPSGQNVTAIHAQERLDVSVTLAPGPRLRFGALRPTGIERTRPERLVEIAGLPTGEVHDPEVIARAEARLRRTGSFATVALRPAEAPNADGTLDTIALIEEAPLRRLGFGAEIDTENGLSLTGFWLHRNLFGGAERLRLEAGIQRIGANVGGLGFNLDLRYTRPATFGIDTDLEIGASLVRLDERDFLADAATLEALLLRRASDRLTIGGGLRLRLERSQFGGATRRALSADFGTLALPLSATFDTRDRPLDSTSGFFLRAEVMPYLGFGSADPGVRALLDARAYQDMGTEGRFVLAARAQVGAIYGSALNRTPRDFLFYTGGGGSVRGLPFRSLGTTFGGVDSGGQGFATLSTEGRARVSDSISLVGFADLGLVTQGAFTGPSDWHAGAGVGLRYDTAIGPLRLDIAVPLRRNASAAGARGVQFYLGIGQAF